MSVSRVHHCDKQQVMAVEEDKLEAPTGKCRCRKYISLAEATKMVERGDATWVVKGRTRVLEDTCSLCGGDSEVVNCAQCRGTGKQEINGVVEEYGIDIVLISRPELDEKKRKHRAIILKKNAAQKKPAIKTPRTPTIESEHIEKAYSDGLVIDKTFASEADARRFHVRENAFILKRVWLSKDKAALVARERIEEYGELIQDARMYQGKDRTFMIGVEPANNPKTGEGRDFDYGRAI